MKIQIKSVALTAAVGTFLFSASAVMAAPAGNVVKVTEETTTKKVTTYEYSSREKVIEKSVSPKIYERKSIEQELCDAGITKACIQLKLKD